MTKSHVKFLKQNIEALDKLTDVKKSLGDIKDIHSKHITTEATVDLMVPVFRELYRVMPREQQAIIIENFRKTTDMLIDISKDNIMKPEEI